MTRLNRPTEEHPFPPFIPAGARALVMGTFPPKSERWSMDFYYPNKINDFWRVIGLVFYGEKNRFIASDGSFRLDDIKEFLRDQGIAMHDTGHKVRRLKDNASDKFLEIVEPVDLDALLARMPGCHLIATTGEKAAGIIAELTGTHLPKMGEVVKTRHKGRDLTITRLPSTSRAYPMKLEEKAKYYEILK